MLVILVVRMIEQRDDADREFPQLGRSRKLGPGRAQVAVPALRQRRTVDNILSRFNRVPPRRARMAAMTSRGSAGPIGC